MCGCYSVVNKVTEPLTAAMQTVLHQLKEFVSNSSKAYPQFSKLQTDVDFELSYFHPILYYDGIVGPNKWLQVKVPVLKLVS